jgi:hypothetical protein
MARDTLRLLRLRNILVGRSVEACLLRSIVVAIVAIVSLSVADLVCHSAHSLVHMHMRARVRVVHSHARMCVRARANFWQV